MMTRSSFTVALALAGLSAGPGAAQRPSPPSRTVDVVVPQGRAWFGFTYSTQPVAPAASAAVELTVRSVLPGSAAEKAGLRAGDQVVAFDGSPITLERLERLGRDLRPGTPLRLTVRGDAGTRALRMAAEAARPPAPISLHGNRLTVIRTDSVIQMMEVILDSVSSAMGRFHVRPGTRVAGAPLVRDSGAFVARVFVDRDGRFRPLEGFSADPKVHQRLLEDARAVHQEEVARLRNAFHAQVADSARWRALQGALSAGELVELRRLENGSLESARTLEGKRLRELEQATTRTPTGAPSARGGGGSVGSAPVAGAWVHFGGNAAAGARFEEIGPAFEDYFGVARGLLVLDVASGTPADRAGLKVGDVVTTAGGRPVGTLAELRAGLSGGGGDGLAIEVVRMKKRRALRLPAR